MSRAAVLTKRARLELRQAVDWIAADDPVAAQNLADAARNAAYRIGANPRIGARRPALAGPRYRFWPLRRFRYLLVYTDATEPPRILRVIHMSRDLPIALANLSE